MSQQQNSNANPASEKTSSELKPSAQQSLHHEGSDINTAAVAEMNKATSMEQVAQIMHNAVKEMEKKYGRPMTYAELRAEFG